MRFRLFVLVLLLSHFVQPPASAEDLVWLTGRVMASDSRSPLKDALVAVYDEKNRVADYAKTDSEGVYTLAVPRSALRLDKKSKGFLHKVAGGVTKLVGGMSGPIRAGLRAAASAVPASGIAAQAGVGVASGVAQNLVGSMKTRSGKQSEIPPGALAMKVTMPGRNDVVAAASVYWMQEEVYRAGRKEQRVLSAWMDPVYLAPAESRTDSAIGSPYLLFSEARIEPSIAEPGQTVILSAFIPTPPEPRTPIVVVGRNSRTGEIIPLSHAGEGRYRGEIRVDKKHPRDDQVITIVAYAEQTDETGRSKQVEDAIQKSGLFDSGRTFTYNPLLVASRNRAEVTLTVVEPLRRKK
jgi:hypothetical protein